MRTWPRGVRAGRAARRRRVRHWVGSLSPVRWTARQPAVRTSRRLLTIRWIRELSKAGLGIGLGFGLILVALPLIARDAMLYVPSHNVAEPSTVGLPRARDVTITTIDGLRLGAWYVPAAGRQRGAVLLLHGNAGNRTHRAPLVAALRDMGLATLVLDYRGFGGNPGKPSQDGLLADADAAATELERLSGFGPDRTLYLGESVGTGPAAWLAARRPPAGLILRSPFPDMVRVASRRVPWLPVDRLLRDRYPVGQWVSRYQGPVLIVAGSADRLVPLSFSQEVADLAGGETVMTVIDGAGHNDRALLDGAAMLSSIDAFATDRLTADEAASER